MQVQITWLFITVKKKKKDILQLLRLESYDSYTINAKRFIIYLKEKYIM